MREHLKCFAALLCAVIFIVPAVKAKEGVQATIHTDVSAAVEASQINISWSLKVEDSDEPFNACAVFIRLIGPTGKSTEAFSECGDNSEGRYDATAIVPCGGIAKIEIGVAGTMTDTEGHSERSDWLVTVLYYPIRD